MDILTVQVSYTFVAPQCAKSRAGIGWKHSPQEFSISNEYLKGSDQEELNQLDELLVLKMFIEPLGSEYVNVSVTGIELNPVDELGRLAVVKEFVIHLARINPDDDSDCPESVTLTFSTEMAAAMGISASFTKTLKKGESLILSNPDGFTVAAGAIITAVNDDTMLDATVIVFAAGYKV